jgi:hypothetical protein
MPKPRRSPIDSDVQAVRIIKDANKQIVPPPNVPLDDGDIPFFANIIEEFARADWSPHQLEIAALLARCMNDFAVEQMLLREEGAVVTGGAGGPVPNPRKQTVQMHSQSILGFRRSLALHAAAKGKHADIAKRVATAKAIQADHPFDDELIARPN